MRRGVNTRDSSPRYFAWTGGSSHRMIPVGRFIPDCTTSRMSPRDDENVCQSTSACSTSACRDSAQKSYCSL